MKTLTIREARRGLSHPEQMFADINEVLVVCRGKPVARILPAQSEMRHARWQLFAQANRCNPSQAKC